jgi:hypothetical protein
MYRCEVCKEVVPPHVESHRVVVETREVQYPFRNGANRPAPWKSTKNERIDDRGGRGRETVREVIACPRCAGKA